MQNINLNLARGDDQLIGVNITNPDGSYYNLSGSSILFDLRKTSYISPTILNKITTGHYGAVSGASYITLDAGDTVKLGTDNYYYNIKLQGADSKLTTLSYGIVKFYPN